MLLGSYKKIPFQTNIIVVALILNIVKGKLYTYTYVCVHTQRQRKRQKQKTKTEEEHSWFNKLLYCKKMDVCIVDNEHNSILLFMTWLLLFFKFQK